MNMDAMASGIGTELPLSPPLSGPDKPESGNEQQHTLHQREQLPVWDVPSDSVESQDSTTATPSSAGQEIDTDGGKTEKMIEKWRLIRLADKNRARKKIYPTHDVHATLFGRNYSKYYEAFQQGLSAPPNRQTVTNTAPAKRHSPAASAQAPKRRRQHDGTPLPLTDQHQAPVVSTQQSAATPTMARTGAKPSDSASTSSVARESSITPRPRSDSAAKGQPPRRKGVGIYGGNWEYVADEEKIPEYLSVAEKIADVEGRTTRRAYAKLTSRESATNSGEPIGSSFEDQVRKSGRARNSRNHVATLEQTGQTDLSPERETNQTSPSASNRSTLKPDDQSRSTSASAATNAERPERPNLSWNAIVYEVLATADAPLTFTQLMQGIQNRWPFFKSSLQEKVLKSGLKNPLYFHEAFCKGDIVNGKQTWGLRPGEFIDKKTGELLTPPPRHPIGGSSSLTEQVQEVEDPNPVDLAPNLSHSHRPRSSNPRFGREILNSPEIPDSQDAIATASTLREAASRISAEHALYVEEPTRSQKLADAAHDTSSSASPEMDASLQKRQTSFNPINTTSTSRFLIAAGSEDQNIRKFVGPIDREASTKMAYSNSALQVAPQRAPSIASSIGESEKRGSPATFQIASTPASLAHALSPTYGPALSADGAGAATSESSHVIPATPTPSATPLPSMQLFLQGTKVGAKENVYTHM